MTVTVERITVVGVKVVVETASSTVDTVLRRVAVRVLVRKTEVISADEVSA